MHRTAVYKHYDEAGTLLYVGISMTMMARQAQHKANSHWFGDVARIEIEWMSDRRAALRRERELIRTLDPLHNKHHKLTQEQRKAEQAAAEQAMIEADAREASRLATDRKLVAFHAVYKLEAAARELDAGLTQVKRWIEDGDLGHIVVGHSTGRNGPTPKIRVTGWQLMDFLESLEKA